MNVHSREDAGRCAGVRRVSLAVILMGVALSSCYSPSAKKSAYPMKKTGYHHVRTTQRAPRGRKPVVALLSLKDIDRLGPRMRFVKAAADTDRPIPSRLRPVLMRDLLKSGELIVVERQHVSKLIEELDFAATDRVASERAPRIGRLIGVQFILIPRFIAEGVAAGRSKLSGKVGAKKGHREMAVDAARHAVVYIDAYEVETGELRIVAVGADIDRLAAVRKAVNDLLDQFAAMDFPIRVARVQDDKHVALDIGSRDGVRQGERFSVWVRGVQREPVRATPGALVRPAPRPPAKPHRGHIEVTEAKRFWSVARVIGGTTKGIRQGDIAQRTKPAARRPAPAPRRPAIPRPMPKKGF